MEELKSCFFFWLQIRVCGEKVENEGRFVPTSNSAMAERGQGEGLENRAFEYIYINKNEKITFYVFIYVLNSSFNCGEL